MVSKRIKNVIKLLFRSFMTLINHMIPSGKIILFNSFPPCSDNPRALYDYIIKERKDITKDYKIYWCQDEECKDIKNVVKKKSLKGFWLYFRAKYIFSSHGYFPGCKSGGGQLQVNLWHGVGYKDITGDERIYRGDCTVITSELYTKRHSRILVVPPDKVYITGLPRNDKLFKNNNALKSLGINKEEFSNVIIWLPTYRVGGHDKKKVDGRADSVTPASFSSGELDVLNENLKNNNNLLIVKLHPIEEKALCRKNDMSNIKYLTNDILSNHGLILYNLLQETDALISDCSSVMVDYTLLNKPIGVVISDIEEFKSNRGFLFKNVTDYMPGPIILDYDGLIDYVNNFKTIDVKWVEKRTKLLHRFHKYTDDKSSERVCDLIFADYKDSGMKG